MASEDCPAGLFSHVGSKPGFLWARTRCHNRTAETTVTLADCQIFSVYAIMSLLTQDPEGTCYWWRCAVTQIAESERRNRQAWAEPPDLGLWWKIRWRWRTEGTGCIGLWCLHPKRPERVYSWRYRRETASVGQLSIYSEQIQRVALTAAIIHPMLSAATICKGRLAAVTRKMRQ